MLNHWEESCWEESCPCNEVVESIPIPILIGCGELEAGVWNREGLVELGRIGRNELAFGAPELNLDVGTCNPSC